MTVAKDRSFFLLDVECLPKIDFLALIIEMLTLLLTPAFNLFITGNFK